MKILFDHQIFRWQVYGGISRYAYELALELATSCGQKVRVIAPIYVNKYLSDAPDELNVIGVYMPKLPRTERIYRLINFILSWPIQWFFSPDIVHETYYSPWRVAPKRAKIVLTVYDMIHERFCMDASMQGPTSHQKMLAVQRADHIICISEQTRQDLIELFGVDPSKTSVVHLGFTLTQNESAREDVIPPRPYLLYVGSRRGYKNFDGLLHAYAASPTLRENLDLICFGGGDFTDEEVNLLHQLELSRENVRHVTGGDAVLASYYRAASVFVYPSMYEGFGIPPLEAMSFSCPVVCSSVSSIPEVVGTAAEMFDPYDSVSIRLALERVVSDSVLRQELIARGMERIKHFSWEKCARETIDVYRRVLL